MPARFLRRRSIIWTVFSTIFGILVFTLLLAALNVIVPPSHEILHGFVVLLNNNLPFFIVIALIFMTGEIFDRFTFPLNLPAPLFHALASVFIVIFFFNVFEFLDMITGAGIYRNLEILRILLSILIFLIVFTGGYFKIFGDLLIRGRERDHQVESPQASSDVKTWNDIGNEFRQLVFDVLQRMREELRGGED
ncbi:MAG TPA: hypothetical protein VKO45_03955 [Methanomicrobiales archaeon]|nr:hypothetical protein [Methanomicrobiales archaeon]